MKKSSLMSLSSVGGLVLILCAATPANAQTEGGLPPPESTPTSPPPAHHSSSGDGAGIGVGAAAFLSGFTAGQFVYDQALFHIEGLLGFSSTEAGPNNRATFIGIGVGGWYHIARGSSSDFSVGAALGFGNASSGGNSAQSFALEPGAQARVFLTPNVALHGRVGFAMVFGDNNAGFGNASSFTLGGQTSGAFGFTYFFR